MKPLLILVSALAIVSQSALAQIEEPSKCGELTRPVEANDIECLVNELIDTQFTELADAKKNHRIVYRKFESDEFFLQSRFISGFTHSAESRVYAIDVNPRLFHKMLPVLPRPSIQAVRGALAHELIHLVDFETSSVAGLSVLLKDTVVCKTSLERSTDERAFERGFALDLELYRYWVEQRLTPEVLEKYEKRFYSSDEIHEWIMTNELARPKH